MRAATHQGGPLVHHALFLHQLLRLRDGSHLHEGGAVEVQAVHVPAQPDAVHSAELPEEGHKLWQGE